MHIPARGKPTVEEVAPPAPPSAGEAALFRARRTALAALPKQEPPLNLILLPGSAVGEPGIVVYLLAGTQRPNLAVLGRHHRALISDDGRQVRKLEAMTKSIIEIPFDGKKADLLAVRHFVTDWPTDYCATM